MTKKITIVGTGMDCALTLTAEAREAIEAADELIGAKRLLELADRPDKPAFASYSATEIARHLADGKYESAAVLMSGDCGFYSGARRLLPLLSGCDVKVIAGISTPAYFCAKLKIPLQDLHTVSLHGRENAIARPVRSHERCFFLLGGRVGPGELCQRLTEYGLGGLTVHVGENLALENERTVTARADELTGLKAEPLCAAIVENPGYERYLPACIPDGEFIRGRVPMTKAEVRCVCVSRLNIERRSVCWDIGAGTGSVSTEMALRCQDGRVYAVERNAEALELIEQNRKKFGCDNIFTVPGCAAEVLPSLSAPDRVFIGGSGGELREIAAAVKAKNPAALVTATAVSLETLAELREVFSDGSEITQIAVTRTKRVGGRTMLSAENPVFAVRGPLK